MRVVRVGESSQKSLRFRRRLSGRRWVLVAAAAVVGVSVLSACGSSAVSGGSSSKASSSAAAGSSAAPSANAAGEVDVSAVPTGAKVNYTNYQQYAKLYPNAFQNYKPPTGKVKYCESTFFLANTFQQGFLTSAKQMVTQLASQGKADPDLEVQSSNNATATQVSQLQSEVQDGCQVILLQPSSTTAFCPAIQTALQKNVLILSAQPIDCNGAITVSFDVYQNSFELADALYKSMNYKGNVLEVTGVPGVADAATATAAATAAMSGHPDLKVVGSYTGQWTASVAQTATSQWLASHPGVTVDGIIDEGAMGVAAETALQQAGKPLAKVSLQEGDCQELAFKKAHPDLVPFITDQAPAPGAYAMINVAQRMLAGQQPVLDTILYPIPGPTDATFDQWYTPDMTVSSTCFASPKPALPALASYLPQFFTGGSTVSTFPEPTS